MTLWNRWIFYNWSEQSQLAQARATGGQAQGQAKAPAEVVLEDVHGRQAEQAQADASQAAHRQVESKQVGGRSDSSPPVETVQGSLVRTRKGNFAAKDLSNVCFICVL
jgi:hypothetical protein